MDIRTLIFGIALLNFSFALLVWIYNRSLRTQNPYLKEWQVAKLVGGFGLLLGWLRPLLPESWIPWAYMGIVLQFIGIAIELSAYCSFLGLPHWRPRIAGAMVVASLLFAFVVLALGSHAIIVTGSGIAGLLYATMAWTMWRRRRRAPELMGLMGILDALLATLLLSKVLIGLLFVVMVPYTSNVINTVLYVTAFVVMASNGFGFLLLTKQNDDRRLQQVLEEMTEADKQQRQFIAMLSHEVRSPLAVIDASAQLLGLRLAATPEHRPVLERMERGVSRLKYFFDNCLTQDRIDSRNYTLQAMQVDMRELIQFKHESIQHLSNQHCVVFDMAPEPMLVSGDEVLLRIMVMNLLSNAFKFAPPGSIVTLRLTRLATPPLAWCRLEVIDQGPGIPDDESERIFHKYQRGRAAERTPGAGLGLAIVKRIVHLHRATVQVHNTAQGGACFVVNLPFAGAPP